MKILKNGVDVTKEASVEYVDNKPTFVTHSGVRQLASAFEIQEDKPKKNTKVSKDKKTK